MMLTARLLVASMLVIAIGCGGDAPGADGPSSSEGDMRLTSTAFTHEGTIPVRYTCDGEDVSPPLRIEGVPEGTSALALVMDDPDAPAGTWDHWVVYDIDPDTREIPEAVPELGTPGVNSWNDRGYGGPCPPSGTHRYVFRVLALSRSTGLDPGVSKERLLEVVEGTTLAEAVLIGLYGR